MSSRGLALAVLVLGSASLPRDAGAIELVDPFPGEGVTVVRGMHGCDELFEMTGIDVTNNRLLCDSRFAGTRSAAGRIVDAGTVITVAGQTMHGCPAGRVMKGIDVTHNLLTCEPVPVNESSTVLDVGTVRFNMHACPVGQAMKGVNVSRNLLACISPP